MYPIARMILGLAGLCALSLVSSPVAAAAPTPHAKSPSSTSMSPSQSPRQPTTPRVNDNTIWWRLCGFGAPENYAVQGFSYHQGFAKIIQYCGHNDETRKPRYGVRHFAPHTGEYQFAVDLSRGYLRGISAAQDWQEMTTAGVLVNPAVETGASIEGNCSSRQLNLEMLDAVSGRKVLLDSRVYRVGWWTANQGFPDRTATAFVGSAVSLVDI